MTENEVAKLTQEAKEYLTTQFIRTDRVLEEKEGQTAGKYVYLQFDTLTNPAGTGEFKVVLCKEPNGEWLVVDFQSLPASGHRR